ncbi:transmembrane protein NRF-6 [Heterostelium album PN500]|uniref:Transmembrane protein NRF-6 n=1 Tax=Heterostelium pallidum (strain ATCC 26659 / Pp 5 / PN500) TaxID=670386 RepID=D3BKE1_HETP5|nr:transmembrane protein NRF-6 [Heterostelium album PN500]EFA78371.1 transmembrane protein NRF-6 [Heterostelium album PN500]|eukprot:XP_020430496.1 transmembrane protein NRF-6 [Heterostelium album PN500]
MNISFQTIVILFVVVAQLSLTSSVQINNNDQLSSSSEPAASPQCLQDVQTMMSYPINALEMWTSTGRSPNDLGNMDDCLQLPSNVSHYCIYQTDYDVPFLNVSYPYMIGLCIPPSCNTTTDIEAALGEFILTMSIIAPVGDKGTSQSYCYSHIGQTYKSWTTGSGVMLGVCICFAMMVVIGTSMEYIRIQMSSAAKKDEFEGLLDGSRRSPLKVDYESSNSIIASIFLSFSLIHNYRSFIGSQSTKRHFDALDGIRTVSTMWVVLGHSLLFSLSPGLDNIQYVFGTVRTFFSFQALPAGEFAVDVFFMLSGFLVAHTLLSQLDSKKAKSLLFWAKYALHRYIRLSPLMYFLLFVYWKLMPMFGSGPMWYQFAQSLDVCDQYWWTNLLYINNLHPSTLTQECFAWGWYLANDMQFYLIAPFVLLSFRYKKIFGYTWVVILLAICFTTNIWLTIKFNIATFFDFSFTSTSFATDIYQKPWTRVGPYAVGLCVAFLYTHETTKKLYDKPVFRMFAYAMALGITMFFSYIPYSGLQGTSWNKIENGLFNAFAHTMFTVGLSFFMMATFYGHGGFLADFFKIKIFHYLSKLTFSTYMIHPIVIWTYQYSRTTFDHYSPLQFAWLYTANIVMSFAAAFLVHLTVEKPFVNLERIIFPPNKNNNESQKHHTEQSNVEKIILLIGILTLDKYFPTTNNYINQSINLSIYQIKI